MVESTPHAPKGQRVTSGSDEVPASLPRVPWSRLALAYAIGASCLEFVSIAVSPSLFRALLVGDAAVGWTVVLASWQGLRAVPHPPPVRALLIAALATGHWLAATLGAIGAVGTLASQ